MSFGSNVEPRKFGRGNENTSDWKCFCGHVNRRYLGQCDMCTLERDFVLANSEEEKDD